MRRIGVRAHGVTLNLACDFEPLLEYVSDSGTTSLSGSTRTATRIFSCVLAGRTMEKPQPRSDSIPNRSSAIWKRKGFASTGTAPTTSPAKAPASFKDVRRVVDAMTAFDLIRPVVRLRRMAVLRG